MDMTRSEAAAQGTPIGPVTVAIRQTPGEVHIETTRSGRTEAIRYLPASAKATGASEPMGSFRWDGAKLVTRLVTDINKQAITIEEVRSLDPTGREMTVEVMLVVEHVISPAAPASPATEPPHVKGINVFVKARYTHRNPMRTCARLLPA